jgi:anti-sigma factor RsiW
MNPSTDLQHEHDAVSELLPLAIGGGLSADERRRLDAHLARCEACRAELALLRDVQAQFAAAAAAVSPDAGARSMERVLARVGAERARAAEPAGWRRWLQAWGQWPASARWLVAGQAALVAVLVVVMLPAWLAPAPAGAPPFETAAGAQPPAAGGPRVRVAWRNDASAAAQRELLAALNANVVGGPSAAGFYVVEFGRGAPADGLARLRARSDLVQWAEPQ